MMDQDTVPPRKYSTENIVHLYTSTGIMLPPDQLYTSAKLAPALALALAECHIYLICRRAALAYDPATFEYSPEFSRGHLIRRVAGATQRIEFLAPSGLAQGGRIEVGPYPHRELIRFDAEGVQDGYLPAHTLPLRAQVEDPSIREFEIIYVGQAYGDGSRSAMDRLRSHSTLQRIFAEMATKRPDDEVMLFLFKYEPYAVISSLGGIANKGIVGDEEDTAHYIDIISNPLSEKHQIALAEAGLIRYFSPEYNEIYKDSFPHDRLKILEECYKLDFAGLVVEVSTKGIQTPLWSPLVGKGVCHIAQFDLHDPNTRRSFFSIVDSNGRHALTKASSPIY